MRYSFGIYFCNDLKAIVGTFRTGKEKTKISAHKYMLSSRSPVFHTMFEGSLPEKRVIDIPDIDTATFQSLLRYIYADEINITNDNVEEVVYASDKYMIAGLKKECEQVLKTTATTEHAAKALHTARIYNLTELQQESLKYIEENSKTCLSSEHTLKLPRESLEIILQSDLLDCTETDICSFFLEWTKDKCKSANLEPTGENLRNMAGTLLYLIRFPIIDMEYFSTDVLKSGIISSDETVSIYQSFFGVKSKLFIKKPRGPVAKRTTYALKRNQSIEEHWGNGGDDALCFIADTDIWIRGVNIFCPIDQNQAYRYQYNEYPVELQLLDKSKKKINSSSTILMEGDYSSVTDIYFPSATLVSAGHKYTLKMTGLPNYTYYGEVCKDTITEKDVTIRFENSPLCTSQTTTQKGQFGAIYFSM